MYSEFDVKKEIAIIESGTDSPIRKARRLISLSRNLRSFSERLHRGADILRSDEDDDGAVRLEHTLDSLHRLDLETRLAAVRALQRSAPLAYRVDRTMRAYPRHWQETKEQLAGEVVLN